MKIFALFTMLLVLAGHGSVAAQEEGTQSSTKPKGPPPLLVVAAPVTSGMREPMTEFVGSVYYSRTSRLAAEIEGRIDQVYFEEGERVKEGQMLVRLNTELLDLTIEGSRGTYEEIRVDIEEAQKSLDRIEPLYKEGSVAEVVFDEHYFKKRRLEKKASVLSMVIDRQLLEKEKMTIYAPFSGLVVGRPVEKGEWIAAGGTVATVADDSEVEVVVDVPGELLAHLKKGRKIDIKTNGKSLVGEFFNFVPKGDVATRTFAAKIRLENSDGLIEGMEARARIPTGVKTEGLFVPRDAVISKFGKTVVFVVREGRAKMVPVVVAGYEGLKAAVSSPDLQSGHTVVTKGNERLRDGQPVQLPPSK